MTEWHPDHAVTESVLAGRLKYDDLAHDERRWVVAELSQSGMTVRRIARHLGCSERQVKRLRAELSTRVMAGYLSERARAQDSEDVALSAREEAFSLRRDVLALRAAVDPRVVDVFVRAGKQCSEIEK